MARRLRIQFAGAVYHVYNRGNYRKPVFGSPDAADAFERCLFEACEQFGWRLHGYKVIGRAEGARAQLIEFGGEVGRESRS